MIKSALFVAIQRGWLAISGFVSILIIPTTLSQVEQGIFFTFLSFAALQSLFEAGISTVVVQFIVHEYEAVKQNSTHNEKQTSDATTKLHALIAFAKSWFAALAIIFLLVVGGFGMFFFGPDVNGYGISWMLPWFVLVMAIALSLINISLASILEGMGKISSVAKTRLAASMVSSIMLWVLLLSGGKLWALSISYLAQSCLAFYILKRMHSRNPILNQLLPKRTWKNELNWRSEVFPLQSKIAISYFCGYIASSALVPYAFKTYGPIEAGKLGLALAVFNAIATILASLTYSANPRYGALVQQKNWNELKRLYFRVTTATISISIPVYILIVLFVYYFSKYIPVLMARIASVEVLIALSLIGLVNVYVGSVATLLRSFKKEPMLIVSLAVAFFTLILMAAGTRLDLNSFLWLISIFYLVVILPMTAWIYLNKWKEYVE